MPQTPIAPLLLVDDEQRNHTALAAVLSGPGRELLHAYSGAEALRLLLGRPVAAVLLDLMMPVMDGIETATLIRARDESRDTPILFLTAAGEERRAEAYALGAVDFLAKPIEPDVLQAKIHVFIELWRRAILLEESSRALAAAARLEGALLAVRTAEHELGNQLATASAHLQMLLRRELGDSEQNQIEGALRAVRQAIDTVQRMQGLTELRAVDWGEGLPPTLDLGR
ncbi:MAG: response regulator [Chloroflexi bacterium]|nr:response regulator [Chloroflexota bacterium]